MNSRQQGYVSVLAVLIASAIFTLVMFYVVHRGAVAIGTQIAIEKAMMTNVLLHSCSELVVQNYVRDVGYTGSEPIVTGTGSCSVTNVNDSDVHGVVIDTEAQYDEITRSMRIIFDATNRTIGSVRWVK